MHLDYKIPALSLHLVRPISWIIIITISLKVNNQDK